ncbi:hypothetical protein E2C01_067838 [Portunus trituberculatus]|uniref:Uncharacterized protein n=1 Tax=Portunus trituberculatus TaxID=210409 RepID=A0A5B7HUP9_PORTR|nr:hypothetical protein [Portunus trituberculatus]
MDTDEEEREPRASWTVDQLQAKIAAVTKGLTWGHQQLSLSQVGGTGEEWSPKDPRIDNEQLGHIYS